MTASGEWVSGVGMAHPTGGYDEVVQELVEGPDMTKTTYLREGRAHRLNGPASVVVTAIGTRLSETYFLEGEEGRRDLGPTQVNYNRTGTVESELWRTGRRLHRTDGPAMIRYSLRGAVLGEVWFLDGERHRLDGPAVAEYGSGGKPVREIFYFRGREIAAEKWPIFIGALADGAPEEWAIAYAEGRSE